ncbi:MAG TPA: hypothetical protein VN213_06655 [Solirubrobacteraceae bacterium]|nr:hypothetical protein [Solirubrobacteraceae bacterium]
MPPSLQSHGAVEIEVPGIGVLPHPWRALTGGARTSEVFEHNPGHMHPGIKLVGNVTVGAMQARAAYDLGKWHGLVPRLRAAQDQGAVCRITDLYLDAQGRVFDRGDTYTAVLSEVTTREYDADNTQAVAEITLGFEPYATVVR